MKSNQPITPSTISPSEEDSPNSQSSIVNRQCLEWTPTPRSSNVLRFAHDPETSTFYVEYKGGTIYAYPEVSAQLHEAAKATVEAEGSIGEFLSAHIKPGRQHRKLGTYEVDTLLLFGPSDLTNPESRRPRESTYDEVQLRR